jgi:hypothetical protein
MKDAKRYNVMELLDKGAITNAEAAGALKLSVRQIMRIKTSTGKRPSQCYPWKHRASLSPCLCLQGSGHRDDNGKVL